MPFFVWLLVIGGVFFWHDPKQAITVDALAVLGQGLGTAILWSVACLRMKPDLGFKTKQDIVLGVGCWGLFSAFDDCWRL